MLCVQVKPDSSVAQRSGASGKLVLVMPKETPQQPVVDVAYLRYRGAGRLPLCRGDTHTVLRVGCPCSHYATTASVTECGVGVGTVGQPWSPGQTT